MAIRDVFKVTRKTFFNPSAWIDYRALVEQNRIIWGIISGIIRKPQPGEPENFDEAMQRQALTEKDVHDAAVTYRSLALVFFCYQWRLSLTPLFWLYITAP